MSFTFGDVSNTRAEVVNIKDPTKSGRVQVRIILNQNDQGEAEQQKLLWVQPLYTGTQLAGVGDFKPYSVGDTLEISLNSDSSSGTILGSTQRTGSEKTPTGSNGKDSATTPEKIELKTGDIPPAFESDSLNAFKATAHYNPFNINFGGTDFSEATANTNFGEAYSREKEKKTSTVDRGKKKSDSKGAGVPTIASASGAPKTVKKALDEVDINRLSEIYKNMHNEFAKIQSMLTFSLTAGGGSSLPSKGIADLLIDALTGALAILVRRYGFERVIEFLDNLLGGEKYRLIDDEYERIIREAIISLYFAYYIYGENDIPISVLPEIIYGDNVPENLVLAVPDLYVQQFFSQENDPYPGYIQWIGPDDEIVYTLRGINDFPFSDSEQYLYSIAERGLAEALDVYFQNEDLILTLFIFIALLKEFCSLIDEKGSETTSGKNSNNFSGNLASLLGSVVGAASQQFKGVHIPNSICNKGELNAALSEFNKVQGKIKQVMKKSFKKAGQIDPSGNISSMLSSITNIQSLISDGLSSSQISSLSSTLAQNIGYLNKITTPLEELSSKVNLSNVNANSQVIDNLVNNVNSNVGGIINIIKGNS